MKFFLYISLAMATLLISETSAIAHTPNSSNLTETVDKPTTITIWVAGICGECKERIESALDVKGVRFSSYNIEKKECTIVYNPKKISVEQLHVLLNEAGHDTANSKASDKAYESLNACCKYRTNANCTKHGEEDHDREEGEEH